MNHVSLYTSKSGGTGINPRTGLMIGLGQVARFK